MQIGIPTETVVGENRVAATPETVKKLINAGHSVVIERGAGLKAAYIDSAYEHVGAKITDDAYTGSQIILKVRAPKGEEIQNLLLTLPWWQCLTHTAILNLTNLLHSRCLHLPWNYCHELCPVRKTWMCCPHKPTWPVINRYCWLQLNTSVCSRC